MRRPRCGPVWWRGGGGAHLFHSGGFEVKEWKYLKMNEKQFQREDVLWCQRSEDVQYGSERVNSRHRQLGRARPLTLTEDERSPVCNGHHLVIWLISHNVIDEAQAGGGPTGETGRVMLGYATEDRAAASQQRDLPSTTFALLRDPLTQGDGCLKWLALLTGLLTEGPCTEAPCSLAGKGLCRGQGTRSGCVSCPHTAEDTQKCVRTHTLPL